MQNNIYAWLTAIKTHMKNNDYNDYNDDDDEKDFILNKTHQQFYLKKKYVKNMVE